MLLASVHTAAPGGLNAGDYIQLAATAVAAIAAGAAWKAAMSVVDRERPPLIAASARMWPTLWCQPCIAITVRH